MNRFSIILILFFAFIIKGIAKDMNTYNNHKFGIKINYPDDWVQEYHPMTVFIFKEPMNDSAKNFTANVNLIVYDDKNLTLEEYVGAAKIDLQNKIKSISIKSTDIYESKEFEYARIIYTHIYGNLHLKVVYYIVLYNGKSYNFTFSATKNKFANYYSLFKKMFESLQFYK